MNAARRLVLLLFALLLVVHGCAAHGAAHHDATASSGLQQTSGEGEAAVAVVYVGVALLAGVAFAVCGVADIFSLPFAIAGYFDCFYCCRAMVDICESLF